MKRSLMASLLTMVLLFGGAWLTAAEELPAGTETPAPPEETAGASEESAPAAPAAAETAPAAGADDAVTLQVRRDGETVTMTLAEFLPGVVRGEMPASFEPQALAAQAVAERTYIRHQMAGERKAAHPDADICTDPNCCSAWVSEEDARRRWGDAAEENENRIRAAVSDTDGQVLLYDGAPILAVFHSSSAGVTARSADVWSADVPYLASVASPEGADTVPNYYSVNTFPEAEFRAILLAAHPEASLDGPAEGWIGPVRRNSSDRVEAVTLGGVALSGTEVRRLFSLRSASFTVEATDGAVTFHVTGYGHGVGMSQYGANEMARQGKTWQEILQWYYTGVTIGTLEG